MMSKLEFLEQCAISAMNALMSSESGEEIAYWSNNGIDIDRLAKDAFDIAERMVQEREARVRVGKKDEARNPG